MGARRALEPAGVAAVEAPEPQVALARRRLGGEDQRPPVGRDHHLLEAGARRRGQGEDHGASGRRRVPPGHDRGGERDGSESGRSHQEGGPAALARGRGRRGPDRAGGGGARPLQVVAGVRDVAQALARVALEAALEHVADGGWRFGGEAAPVDLAREDGGEDVRDRLAVEQPLAGQHLEQHDTEGPDVGALVDRLAPRLLGRHVGGGAEDEAGGGAGLGEGGRLREIGARRGAGALARPGLGEAEVEDLDLAVRRHLHVRGLEVAVDDALLVSLLEGLGDLLRDGDRLVDRDLSALQALREVLAFDQLHDEDVRLRSVRERRALEAVEVGDAGVVEGGEDLGLALEPGEAIGVGGEGLGEKLESHVAAQRRVGGAVDLAHAARPEGRGDLVVRQGLSDQDRLPSAELPHSTSATTRHLGEGRDYTPDSDLP